MDSDGWLVLMGESHSILEEMRLQEWESGPDLWSVLYISNLVTYTPSPILYDLLKSHGLPAKPLCSTPVLKRHSTEGLTSS